MSVAGKVLHLRRDQTTAEEALAVLDRFLVRAPLKPHTVRAYRRQAAGYVAWLAANPTRHPDAFLDAIGAAAAIKGWRRVLLDEGRAASTINQALAAVSLMYSHALHFTPSVKRNRVPRPGAPDALDENQEGAVRRAAERRGVRDSSIIEFLFSTGARVEEAAGVKVTGVAITERLGTVRLVGKGDEVRDVHLTKPVREKLAAWLAVRPDAMAALAPRPDPGTLWLGQRGAMTVAGITKVVLAVGAAAGLPGLRPHRLRHTFATRLRQRGMDPAVIQAAMGHASIETTQRYFRASEAEVAAAMEKAFEDY